LIRKEGVLETLDLSSVTDADLAEVAQVGQNASVDFDDCYQCGKCTAGCPMVHEMDLVPRQLIRMLQLGFIDRVLGARTPWICANCKVCSARCPQGVDIAAIMLAVRRAAKKRGLRPMREADIFDDAFVANIRSFGKSNEAILAAKYNLLSGHLTQDLLNAPRMALRGMIGPRIHSVRDKAAVRRLVDRAISGTARAAESPAAGAQTQVQTQGSITGVQVAEIQATDVQAQTVQNLSAQAPDEGSER
jgi:heterodisulfide reductase subunit C